MRITKARIKVPVLPRPSRASEVPPNTTAAIAFQLECLPRRWVSGHQLRGDDQPDEGGAEAADHVHEHFRGGYTRTPDSSAARLVAADGIDVAAKRRACRDEPGDHGETAMIQPLVVELPS